MAMRDGFNHVIPHLSLISFSARELETILSGQPEVDIAFIRLRTIYEGYSPDHSVVKWLWEVLESFSQVRSREYTTTTTADRLPKDVGEGIFIYYNYVNYMYTKFILREHRLLIVIT